MFTGKKIQLTPESFTVSDKMMVPAPAVSEKIAEIARRMVRREYDRILSQELFNAQTHTRVEEEEAEDRRAGEGASGVPFDADALRHLCDGLQSRLDVPRPDLGGFGPAALTYQGIPIVINPLAVHTREDWSGCRSPSRARRRAGQGHPQRVRRWIEPAAYLVSGRFIMHPAIARKLSATHAFART